MKVESISPGIGEKRILDDPRKKDRREFLQDLAGGLTLLSSPAGTPATAYSSPQPAHQKPVMDKLVVLTFDDAAKTHRTFVAPFLKDLGFGATFFVCHKWMNDHENFMNWGEIAEIHRMGFEIGNHTWTHGDFASPRNVAHLAGELALVERQLRQVGVPRPVSFSHPGNAFGPESVRTLAGRGYRWGRRGMQPEVPYGEMQEGPVFDPKRNHPLLIPTTGDAYPDWTLEYFKRVVASARDGKIVVLQFHGVPDQAHAWVSTPPENFRKYMIYLKENGYQAIAVHDLEQYVDLRYPPDDPALKIRYPKAPYGCPDLPVEVLATRADLRYWLENMLRYHRFTLAEAARACAYTEEEVRRKASDFGLHPLPPAPQSEEPIRVLPYPGGRSPRIGFQEGEVDPRRGTKASVFLPWDPTSYVVVDLPEAIFCNLGLIFLAHCDIPTLWDSQNLVLENIDWTRGPGKELHYQRTLPNYIVFGAVIRPVGQHVELSLWLRNFCGQNLTGFETQASPRGQVCVMLKGSPEFNQQTNDNKIFSDPAVAVRSSRADRWILTAWESFGRAWGNPLCPCMHSDPALPYCAYGQTVRVHGRLWFYEGKHIHEELRRAKALLESQASR